MVSFREIKAHVSLVDVLSRYKIELRAKNQYKREGRCPLPQHGNRDGKPSFHIDFIRNVWVWACHESACVEARGGKKKGGDLIEFVGFMEKVGLKGAGELLDSWFGPFSEGSAAPAPKVPPREVVAANEVNPPLKFQLRDIDHAHPYLLRRGFEVEECEFLGVGFFPGKGSMAGRVVFPIHDSSGQLVAYAGRLIDDGAISDSNPRWKYPAGFHRGLELYNLHRVMECIHNVNTVVACESQWGVMACIRAGIMNSVAVMSNEATEEQVRKLAGFKRVIICFDGDKYGQDGSRRLAEKLAGKCEVEVKTLALNLQPDLLRPDTLRACLGFTREPEGTLELTTEAHSLLAAES